MDGAEQVQTHLKAKVGSHAMKGKQLKEQQEYQFTQLIPNLGGRIFSPLFCCKNAEIGHTPAVGHTPQFYTKELFRSIKTDADWSSCMM